MRFTRQLYFIVFGATVLVAVGSYWWQFPGLAGTGGIWPLRNNLGPDAGWSLLRLSTSDAPVHALLALCCACGLALMLGFAPRVACVVLWACWTPLLRDGYPFLAFQWDVLLGEAAFWSAFYAPAGLRPRLESDADAPRAVRWVMYLLACKVTLESGLVKLLSGDPSWRDWTALTWHWWTQPLPTWTSVYLAQLPLELQRVLCGLVFVFELAVPLLALGPRRARLAAALGLMALQAALTLSGNFAFYGLLTAALAIPLLDDAALRRVWKALPVLPDAPRERPWQWALPAFVLVAGVGAFLRQGWTAPLHRAGVVNAYGAFARMTKSRAEILIEGSADGVTWRPYELPWKPGDVTRRPQFVAPWQPRLDWQLWFASLGRCEHNPWLISTQEQLLRGNPAVQALFAEDPFQAAPPRLLRTRSFEYRFAPLGETGVWWTRTEVGPYCPVLELGPDGRLRRAQKDSSGISGA